MTLYSTGIVIIPYVSFFPIQENPGTVGSGIRYPKCARALTSATCTDQTFSFPCLSERISLFKLFEIEFLVVFDDLEGLFCAEDAKFFILKAILKI